MRLFFVDKSKKLDYYIDILYIDILHKGGYKVDRSLTSGSMGMMLLKLLSEKDMYGYEMIETLRQRSQNVFELKAGTLYPLLHNLEAKGYLSSYEQEKNGKTRVYYSISKQGKSFLKEKTEEWDVYVRAVSNVLSMS